MNPQGFLVKPRDSDYVLGVSSPLTLKSVMPSGDWTSRLFFYEAQKYTFDTNGCVLFTVQESFDSQMDIIFPTLPPNVQQQIIDMGFLDQGLDGNSHFHSSPRFLEIMTGNRDQGNSLPEGWDAIRAHGVLPWKDLPFTPDLTLDAYFAPLPQMLLDKALKFLNLIGGKPAVSYHWILNGSPKNLPLMKTALTQAPLCLGIAVTNWNQDVPSDPPTTDTPGHSVMDYKQDASNVYIYDHYEPAKKTLDIGYPVHYVLQGIVNPIIIPPLPAPLPPAPNNAQISNWITAILNWISAIRNSLKPKGIPDSEKVAPSEIDGIVNNPLMNKFWNWLVKSSADPTQVALTVKGLLSTVVPVLLVFVHNPNLSTLPDDVYSLIVAAFGVYSAVAVVYGLARKVWFSIQPPQA